MVYLLEPSLLELRIAGGVGAMPGEAIGAARRQPARHFARLRSRPGPADHRRRLSARTRFSVPARLPAAGLTSAVGVPLSDRGRTIGVLAVRSRVARSFGDDEVRFLESLANLLTSGLQRAQSEEALNHAQRLESVGQLTGGIAHDFNNLLTVIQGNLQVLAELPADADDAAAPQLVDAAFRASRRGAELTGKLLAFSRRQVLQPLDVDAAAMLHSLADMLRRTLDQRIRIEVEIPPGGVAVRADPGQLESALLNIAINARDAMPGGGMLRFRVELCAALPETVACRGRRGRRRDGFVAIAIDDSGTGMTAEARERAFEPFFTTKEAGPRHRPGPQHRLRIRPPVPRRGHARQRARRGARPSRSICRGRPAERARAARSPSRRWTVPTGLAVLLVEDDAEVRSVMRRFLETLGCEVNEAASGEQAMLLLDAGASLRPAPERHRPRLGDARHRARRPGAGALARAGDRPHVGLLGRAARCGPRLARWPGSCCASPAPARSSPGRSARVIGGA